MTLSAPRPAQARGAQRPYHATRRVPTRLRYTLAVRQARQVMRARTAAAGDILRRAAARAGHPGHRRGIDLVLELPGE